MNEMAEVKRGTAYDWIYEGARQEVTAETTDERLRELAEQWKPTPADLVELEGDLFDALVQFRENMRNADDE